MIKGCNSPNKSATDSSLKSEADAWIVIQGASETRRAEHREKYQLGQVKSE